MNRTLQVLSATALLLLPLGGSAATADRYRGQGYVYFGPGTTRPVTLELGFGGEGFIYKGLGAAVELGYAGEAAHFSDNGVGIGSADLTYHFHPGPKLPRVDPFAVGGYTLYFLHGHASGYNLGGGVNIWLKKHAALRLEIRDQANGAGVFPRFVPAGADHLVNFRIGLTFR